MLCCIDETVKQLKASAAGSSVSNTSLHLVILMTVPSTNLGLIYEEGKTNVQVETLVAANVRSNASIVLHVEALSIIAHVGHVDKVKKLMYVTVELGNVPSSCKDKPGLFYE